MRILGLSCLIAVLLIPALDSEQASTAGKILRATPTPTPTPARLPVQLPPVPVAAPSLAGPRYSPFQLDFGTIDYSASSRRMFSLTAPTAGEVTVQFPPGIFVPVELRRIPPPNAGKGQSIQPNRRAMGPTKPVPFYVKDLVVLYKWNLAAGEEIQLDILFTPGYLKDATPGARTGSMEFSGPGNQPWRLHVPMQGVVAGPLVQVNPVLGSNPQTKKPSTTATPSSNALGTVSALPTPPSAPPQVQGAAPVLNVPVHSPDQFDFGDVWDGDMTRKTFHLTTTSAGYVTVQIPKGPFRVAEYREMGAVKAPSKNQGNKPQGMNIAPYQEVKSKISYQDGQNGPFQWSLAPNTDIQIDIAFQPHFQFGSEMAGQKSATMKVTGPGLHGNWTVSVPLAGMFDGLKISATMAPETKEILAIAGEKFVPLNVTMFGLSTPVNGTIHAGNTLPAGVTVMSKSVKIGANQKVPVTVWLSLGSIHVSKDRTPEPLELVFDDGQKTSKALFQFTGLPASLSLASGERNDCVVSHLLMNVSLQAPMHSRMTGGFYISSLDDNTADEGGGKYDVQMSMPKNLNLDGYSVGSFLVYAESGGVSVFSESYWPTYETQNGTEIKKTGPVSVGRSAKKWAQILDGHARFGCQLSRYMNHQVPEDLCERNYECTRIRWAPAVP